MNLSQNFSQIHFSLTEKMKIEKLKKVCHEQNYLIDLNEAHYWVEVEIMSNAAMKLSQGKLIVAKLMLTTKCSCCYNNLKYRKDTEHL